MPPSAQVSSSISEQANRRAPTEIDFAGSSNLLNRLLTCFISEQLSVPCHIRPLEQCGTDSANLLLINLQEYDDRTLNTFLHRLQNEAPLHRVALINTENSRDISAYLAWPVIKGIFHCDNADRLLIEGLNAIAAGEYWFSRQEMNLLAKWRQVPQPSELPDYDLTDREMEILRWLSRGMSNLEIAEALYLSPHTIKTHLYNLYRKLDVKNRTQAVKLAQALIEPQPQALR